MADVETHTREELEGMSRLVLRRICKARGMSSEECSKMEFDDMVNWIDENQGGGGNSKPKAAPKAAKGGAKKAAPKGGTKKAPPKAPPKGRSKAAAKDEPEDSPGLIGDEILAKVTALDEKIDTVGEVMDQNLNAITEDMNELRADVYKVLELLKHMGNWMEADQILTPDNAPDSLGFPEKEAEIDEACSGNEEGGE
jgi:hypothetical protein